ncbi:MAG: Zn-ribbon domain-containing OB-fold protein [Thermoplasmatales archaeon]|nr:Zn-ribbon domain-containing OB-fold protein [Thermoplasmatales archaeon]
MPIDTVLEDRRVLDLRYRMPISQIIKFFEGLEEGKVRGTRCKECGRKYFPPQTECPTCMTKNTEWFDFEGDASLETFTTVEVVPTSFVNEGSYVVAIGLLKEGVRILSWLNTQDRSTIKIGMKMKLKAVKREEGYYSYEFFSI